MPDPGWWQPLWPDPQNILHKIGLDEAASAIDLCCGDGLFTTPMSQILGGRLTAVDLDPILLTKAQQALIEANAPPCQWVEGDAMDLPSLIPEKVDFVLMANTFHGVPDQTKLSQVVAEVLNPKGRFVIINWHVRDREKTPVLGVPRGPRTEMRMSPDDVRDVVEPAGFVFEQTIELEPYHYAAVFKVTSVDKAG
ncbi:MAG: class I SAM-dependent methyltransferase [Rhodospirillaceae bacterium]|nr:class I SAM-dependent methyltransferase [Rhodospirillaceae bacterium]MBT4589316.1 class I SAM-dependent methyltransferase [Rhodospirillaceae bacterium]MBT5938814.1 class I SAM-dependent methyltransferase [Rhodospirillaceae bacterium]MBT7266754.1 class I SAM-dependent methyltransferase [Rhodospirillaceae bacterium]